LSSHVPPYVSLCLDIVRMVALPGIKVTRDCWGCVVGYAPVEHAGDHFAGDIVFEFFDMFSNVAQKDVAGPATNHHDEKHGTSIKEHSHCRAQADGVCANLVGGNVEGVLSNCQGSIPQRVLDLLGGDVFDTVVLPDGRDWGVVVGSWVGSDPANDGSSCPDWAQCDVA
jgi:hypothetical protein